MNPFSMKKIILILTGFFLVYSGIAQTFQVAGKIVDQVSKQPLTGASVFCQNTTLGTVTNASGEFTMWLNNGGYDLVISFTGYETQSIRISNSMENVKAMNFELKQKEKSLEEVSIQVSNEVKDGWNKYGKFFIDNFIGMSVNSTSCKIENPEAIKFFFSKKRNRLKITAKEDVIITNNALGYKIRYQLDSFTHEYGSGVTQYTGYPFFEELQGSADQAAAWKVNREKAYYGSLLHFMRCYYDSTLGDNSYKIELVDAKTNKTKPVYNPYDSSYFNIVNENDIELAFPGKLRIVYAQEKPEKEYLSFQKLDLNTTVQVSLLDLSDPIVIEENGYFYEQKDIISLGYWGWEKIADFLPYNYEPQD